MTTHSLYAWLRRYGPSSPAKRQQDESEKEIRRLKGELRRVTEERDTLKKGRHILRQGVRVRYGFIQDHCHQFPVQVLCRVLQVHPSGYYAWVRQPVSAGAKADARQTDLVEQSWRESGGVYGYRKVYGDLQEFGEHCGKHRTYRLTRLAGLRSQTGYKRRKVNYGGRPANVAPNTLDREFTATRPSEAWVTDRLFAETQPAD